jgi:hypothetical protein
MCVTSGCIPAWASQPPRAPGSRSYGKARGPRGHVETLEGSGDVTGGKSETVLMIIFHGTKPS